MEEQAVTAGIHHLGLTVPDVTQARDFFVDVLGFRLVRERPDYPAAFVSDGFVMLTLWQALSPKSAVPFDRKNVIGLHHFALQLSSSSKLDEVYARLRAHEGVEMEFAPESLAGSATQHLMCTIPGGIRMEIIAPSA